MSFCEGVRILPACGPNAPGLLHAVAIQPDHFRCAARDNPGMRIDYVSKDGAGPAFEIDADRHGSYTIKHEGRVVKRVTAVSNYVGKPKWGSKKLELSAIEDAKAAVEAMLGPRA